MSRREHPVLVFDGDCAFCTSCARLLERIGPDAEIVAWQLADLAALGLTAEQAAEAVRWVEVDGTVRSGHEAIAAILIAAGPLWRIAGRILLLPGISRIAAKVYRLVAGNRHRLPGSTRGCAVTRDFYASPFGVAYSAYMERPWLSRRISRWVWGGDISPYYEAMSAVTSVPDGSTVVDCPCGAGAALRALTPAQDVRYLAIDLSPSMLRRATARAARRRLRGVELTEADASDLPLATDSADLFLSFWGLHCFEEPERALAEAARVLRPGGRLVGSTFVRGTESRRQRALIRPGRGDFGRVLDAADVEAALRALFAEVTITRSGPMLFFDGTA